MYWNERDETPSRVRYMSDAARLTDLVTIDIDYAPNCAFHFRALFPYEACKSAIDDTDRPGTRLRVLSDLLDMVGVRRQLNYAMRLVKKHRLTNHGAIILGLDITAYGSSERIGDVADDYQDGCTRIYIEAGERNE